MRERERERERRTDRETERETERQRQRGGRGKLEREMRGGGERGS